MKQKTREDECIKRTKYGLLRGEFRPHKKYCDNNCNEYECYFKKKGE